MMQLAIGERQRISQQAAIWLSILQEIPTPEQRSAFVGWLDKSPWHSDIFKQVACHFSEVLAAEQTTQAANEDLLPLTPAWVGALPIHRPRPYTRPTNWVPVYIAGALFVAVVAGSYLKGLYVPRHEHDLQIVYTDAGTYQLGRNSTMALDIHSRAEVQHVHDSAATRVRVLAGHAAFAGVHDSASPLSVLNKNVVIQVRGTAFDVYDEPSNTTIKVTQGQVHVLSYCQPPSGSAGDISSTTSVFIASEADLEGGQGVRVSSGSCHEPLQVRSLQDAVFQHRDDAPDEWLNFNGGTVQQAVEKFNQHGPQRIVVSDPILADKPFVGRFQSSQVESFLKVLALDFNAKIHRSTEPDGSKVIYVSLSTRK